MRWNFQEKLQLFLIIALLLSHYLNLILKTEFLLLPEPDFDNFFVKL